MSASASKTFFGGLLVTAGVLIATLSGLCSLGFVAAGLGGVLKGPAVMSNLLLGLILVGIVGGVPFAIGVALAIAGRAVMRPRRPRGADHPR